MAKLERKINAFRPWLVECGMFHALKGNGWFYDRVKSRPTKVTSA